MTDIELKLAFEAIHMQLDSLMAATITHTAQLRHIANEAGIVIEKAPLTETEEQHRAALIKSVAKRMVNMAVLVSQQEGVEADPKKLSENVFKMISEAAKTRGESIGDEESITEQVFDGAFVEPVGTETGRARSDEPSLEELPASDDMADAFAYALDSSVPDPEEDAEDPENLEDATDEDLLAVFRTTRKARVSDPYVEFEDGVIRANFYSPDTVPLSPEEFVDYDKKAITYFQSILDKTKRAGLIDAAIASQVNVVLHGGVNFNQEEVMSEDGKITETIIQQGHELPYFEIMVETSKEAAETIIAAYSVSIARLRGMYMQAKLEELQEYMEAPE